MFPGQGIYADGEETVLRPGMRTYALAKPSGDRRAFSAKAGQTDIHCKKR